MSGRPRSRWPWLALTLLLSAVAPAQAQEPLAYCNWTRLLTNNARNRDILASAVQINRVSLTDPVALRLYETQTEFMEFTMLLLTRHPDWAANSDAVASLINTNARSFLIDGGTVAPLRASAREELTAALALCQPANPPTPPESTVLPTSTVTPTAPIAPQGIPTMGTHRP